MSQTSYSIQAADAFAGQLGDPAADAHIRSMANEEASAVEFGLGVVAGTDPEAQFLKPSAGGQTLLGVLVHQHSQEVAESGLSNGETGGVMSKGRIWVQVDEAVVAGDPVFVRHTGAAAAIGKFRNDADTANADAVPNARFVKGGSTVALLELNLPG